MVGKTKPRKVRQKLHPNVQGKIVKSSKSLPQIRLEAAQRRRMSMCQLLNERQTLPIMLKATLNKGKRLES
eukprot:4064272-Amphidinium_carterae.1